MTAVKPIVFKLCCYDLKYGNLVDTDLSAGFIYGASEDISTVLATKDFCCGGSNDWNNCQRFYDVYQPNTCLLYKEEKAGWSGGDPNILSYDNRTYTFNGNGEYILTQANDLSFRVQMHTKIVTNVNVTSIKGTLYSGFAIKTIVSPIIQFELDDSIPSQPDLSKV